VSDEAKEGEEEKKGEKNNKGNMPITMWTFFSNFSLFKENR